jgi:hypothetical protein
MFENLTKKVRKRNISLIIDFFVFLIALREFTIVQISHSNGVCAQKILVEEVPVLLMLNKNKMIPEKNTPLKCLKSTIKINAISFSLLLYHCV